MLDVEVERCAVQGHDLIVDFAGLPNIPTSDEAGSEISPGGLHGEHGAVAIGKGAARNIPVVVIVQQIESPDGHEHDAAAEAMVLGEIVLSPGLLQLDGAAG